MIETPRGGGISIFTHTKKRNRTKQNPFRAIPPPPWMPLLRDSPLLPWKPFGTLGRGVPIFGGDSRGGVPKLYGDSEGGRSIRFLRALFPKRTTPPPYEKF